MPLKTDDLIHMLAEDAPAPPMRIGRAMTLALLLSTAISIVPLLCTIGCAEISARQSRRLA